MSWLQEKLGLERDESGNRETSKTTSEVQAREAGGGVGMGKNL